MENFLLRCNERILNEECIIGSDNCRECFKDSYFDGGADVYSCFRGCLYYAMYYFPIYISEAYYFLESSRLLETIGKANINIVSLGGGIGPDYCAIKKYISDQGLNINIHYTNYDNEENWREIIAMHCDDQSFVIHDLSKDSIKLTNIDIVFISKLFTTLINNNKENDFFNAYRTSLKSLPSGSYVVYNDIVFPLAWRRFIGFMRVNGFAVRNKFYFMAPGVEANDFVGWTPIGSTDLAYDIDLSGLLFDICQSVKKTVVIIFQKS